MDSSLSSNPEPKHEQPLPSRYGGSDATTRILDDQLPACHSSCISQEGMSFGVSVVPYLSIWLEGRAGGVWSSERQSGREGCSCVSVVRHKRAWEETWPTKSCGLCSTSFPVTQRDERCSVAGARRVHGACVAPCTGPAAHAPMHGLSVKGESVSSHVLTCSSETR